MASGTPMSTGAGELSLTLVQSTHWQGLTPWRTDYNLNKFAISYPDWIAEKDESSGQLVEQLDRAHITPETTYPILSGGCAYIYKGTWQKGQEVLPVAIKVLHVFKDGYKTEWADKMFRREIMVWKRLKHENILELYGVTSGFGPFDAMVCPWQENGSLSSFLERFGDDLSLNSRFRMLTEVAAGLTYLHASSIIHGDLTGGNILIGADRKVRLSDFGLSNMIFEMGGGSYLTASIVTGAMFWVAPELVGSEYTDPLYSSSSDDPRRARSISTRSDIYSFGSVMFQILTNKIPYHYLKHLPEIKVVILLNQGKHPERPSDAQVTDEYWEFMKKCWECDPADRPDIELVSKDIQRFYAATLEDH